VGEGGPIVGSVQPRFDRIEAGFSEKKKKKRRGERRKEMGAQSSISCLAMRPA